MKKNVILKLLGKYKYPNVKGPLEYWIMNILEWKINWYMIDPKLSINFYGLLLICCHGNLLQLRLSSKRFGGR